MDELAKAIDRYTLLKCVELQAKFCNSLVPSRANPIDKLMELEKALLSSVGIVVPTTPTKES